MASEDSLTEGLDPEVVDEQPAVVEDDAGAAASAEGDAAAEPSQTAVSDAGDELNDAVDAAYHTKYARHSGYVEPMVGPQARATTLRLVPDDRAARS